MKNLGVYSEIVNISADNSDDKKAVIFSESGDTGTGEVIWERKYLSDLQFFNDLIKGELEEKEDTSNNENYKESLKNILKEQKCSSYHALTFLKWIEEIAKILERKDSIQFKIKDDHPMRININFSNLGNTTLLYFLAPRVETEEIDEDEELEDF